MVASWPGTKMVSGGKLPDTSDSHRSFALWGGMSAGPSIWELTSDISFPRLLNLAAIDMKLVAVNWNSGFSHSMWVQRPWQEIKKTTWFGLAMSLSHCLGLHLYATNGGSLLDVGMPPTREKGSHLPPRTTKLGNLRDSHDPSQLPLLNQILGFFCSVFCWEPTQGCQKCDRMHRDARWIGGLSHQSSNLSHLHNLLWKVVIHALLNTGFKGIQVVTYLANCQTTKVILTKVFPNSLGACTSINKENSSSWIYSCSTRGTNIARVEGWWVNRPRHSVAETQMTAPKPKQALLIYFPPQIAWAIIVTSSSDVTIICSNLSAGKPLCMHKGNAIGHLHICWHHCQNPHLP